MSKVYDYVTEQIIKQLESGVVPWKKPWSGNSINYVSRKPYRGINTFLLSKGGEYITFKQAKEAGGTIRKGSKSEMVVFFKVVDKKTIETEQEGDKYFILRYYKVFHLSDIEGLESKIVKKEKAGPIEEAEQIIKSYKDIPPITHSNNNKAYYSPMLDLINVPPLEDYPITEEYYSTLFHELSHSTGHKKRLDRFEGSQNAMFGSETYSKEELVAEFTASMLCGVAGIEQKTINNSASYIKGWLSKLKNDNRLLVKAAAQAQKAADYIRDIKTESVGTDEPEPTQ